MSELSPLDILGKKFKVTFRGYPINEVHEYMAEIAGAMEGLMRERGELRVCRFAVAYRSKRRSKPGANQFFL